MYWELSGQHETISFSLNAVPLPEAASIGFATLAGFGLLAAVRKIAGDRSSTAHV